MYERKLRMHGMANPKFLESNHLDYNSHQTDWFKTFVPSRLTDCWTSYTNTKAMIHNAGQKGKPYPDFINFTCNELKKHIGLFILQGISVP